jgi:chromosome transmission fidelity protein 1
MTWLRDHKRKILYDGMDESCKDEPDWIKRQVRETKLKEAEDRLHEFEARAEQIRKIESTERLQRSRVEKRIKTHADVKKTPDYVEFLLADYTSDSERCYDAKTGVSTDVQRLLNQLSEESAGVSTEDEKVKIFFASRTHSQLSQFVSQLRLTGFPSYVDAQVEQSTKHVALGSRKQLCINPTVENMSTTQAINDACVDLQRSSGQGCEFLKSERNPVHRPALNRFKESVVSEIRDIEDLADLGRQQSICPYYALRATVPQAEIITLPYQLIVQRESRDALGFDLRGSIVIIDEAHNLLDTISSIHSSHVSASDVTVSLCMATV